MTAVGKVLFEALVIGLTFVLIFALVHMISMKLFGDSAMTNHGLLFAQVGLAAGFFHLLCEWVGLNEWYCQQR